MAANTGYTLGYSSSLIISTGSTGFDSASATGVAGHVLSIDPPDKMIEMIPQTLLGTSAVIQKVPGAHDFGTMKFKIQYTQDGNANPKTFQGDPSATGGTMWKAPKLDCTWKLPLGTSTTPEIWRFDAYMARVNIESITATGIVTADVELALAGTNQGAGTGYGIAITPAA